MAMYRIKYYKEQINASCVLNDQIFPQQYLSQFLLRLKSCSTHASKFLYPLQQNIEFLQNIDDGKMLTIQWFGDEERGKEIDIHEVEGILTSANNQSIIACILHVFYEKEKKIKPESLATARKLFSTLTDDVEIFVNSRNIHASEAKYTSFVALKSLGLIHGHQIIHHILDSSKEKILINRIAKTVKSIQKAIEAFETSIPKSDDIRRLVIEIFHKRFTKLNIRDRAENVILYDGSHYIGDINSGRTNYMSEFAIRRLKHQLIEKTIENLCRQIGDEVVEETVKYILNHLQEELVTEPKLLLDLSSDELFVIRAVISAAVVSVIGVILGDPLIFLLAVVGTAIFVLYRVLVAVNVNGKTWRWKVADELWDKIAGEGDRIRSKIEVTLRSEFGKITNELSDIKISIPSVRIPADVESVYDEDVFAEHHKLKSELAPLMRDSKIKEYIKKIILSTRNSDHQIFVFAEDEIDSIRSYAIENGIGKINVQMFGKIIEESEKINKYMTSGNSWPYMDVGERKRLTEAVAAETTKLMTLHSNLVIIEPTTFKSSSNDIRNLPCIALYCIGKGIIPIGETEFPATLHGFEVDVREGCVIQSICRNCSIGNVQSPHSGSRGFFGKSRLNPNDQGYITAAHVACPVPDILTENVLTQKLLVQSRTLEVATPSMQDYNPQMEVQFLGQVLNIHYGQYSRDGMIRPVGLDVAFVRMDTSDQRYEINHTPNGTIGPPIYEIITDKPTSLKVVKCGRTTGETNGYLTPFLAQVKSGEELGDFFVILENLYHIYSEKCFFQRGDSGSGIYLVSSNRCLHPIGIAHHIGNNGGKECYASPIKYVCDALEVDVI